MKENFEQTPTKHLTKLKICGMRDAENILEIASLLPEYMGFIFYKNSPRYFEGHIPIIDASIKKTGVFVAENIPTIIEKVKRYNLQAVQLHGQESTSFCADLKKRLGDKIELIKVFLIDENFCFDSLEDFNDCCDYFLLDTKAKFPGGNGVSFDWKLLARYSLKKPFFLSGGIGLQEVEIIKQLLRSALPIYGIDINSKVEIAPGVKNRELCKETLRRYIQ